MPGNGHVIERAGKRYGELRVLRRVASPYSFNGAVWLCQCSCGRRTIVLGYNLGSGKSTSCGQHARGKEGKYRASKWNSPEYTSWRCMRGKYAPRGIAVCRRWRASFTAFLADVGKRPGRGYRLYRKDKTKGFSPLNCGWARQGCG